MKLPAPGPAPTRLDVVRITAGPETWGEPMTGDVVARWTGPDLTTALTVIGKLPPGEPNLCGFAPGWGIRAYADPAPDPLYEAAFCYSCHIAWLWGPAVAEALRRQPFDAGSPNAQYLLLRFRDILRPAP
ncbi:hypothetical protein ACFWP3_36375 [Streptomyces sp. NPDC058525]|uniref:hypothetical protein n=1 Tax=Streptomyces sp. NPDC058525 TaxID=3346538 RepID=UPI003664E4E4